MIPGFTDGGDLLKLRVRKGRNQQGLCFVSSDKRSGIFRMRFNGKTAYVDVRISEKVPPGTVILDSRISDNLGIVEDSEVLFDSVSENLPPCTEIHLGVVSTRGLDNEKVAHAMSKRIDDFREHLDGLILFEGQEFMIIDFGINLQILSLDPKDTRTNAAQISWEQLLKIHLAPMGTHPFNLCILVETAAATQNTDVSSSDGSISRHQAISNAIEHLGKQLPMGQGALFSGIAFSEEVVYFKTFDSQTGEETEVSSLHSPSLLRAYNEWLDEKSAQNENAPSNPGEALKRGLATARTLTDRNGFQTAVLLFSSGVYSAGQNPVKITRTESGHPDSVMVFTISVGLDSIKDIMEAIAEEGGGVFIHLDEEEKTETIVDSIEKWLFSKR